MRLAGRRAVVTGASGGIGQAIASAFVREGAKVVAHYHSGASSAAQFAAKSIANGGEAWAVSADVADMRAVEQLVGEAQSLLGGIDIWANIAGADILTGTGAMLSDADKLARLIDVDLRCTIQCCRAVSSVISRGGAIINMSWDLALIGMRGRNPEMFSSCQAQPELRAQLRDN